MLLLSFFFFVLLEEEALSSKERSNIFFTVGFKFSFELEFLRKSLSEDEFLPNFKSYTIKNYRIKKGKFHFELLRLKDI